MEDDGKEVVRSLVVVEMATCIHPLEPERFVYAINDFSAMQALSYGFFAPISCFSDVLLMCLYATRSTLRQPPGDIILWQMIGQLILDLGWMYPGLHFFLYQTITDGPVCKIISLSSIYSITICCGYNIALVVEIFEKLSQPFSMSYDRRKWIYHTISHVLAIFCSLSASITASLGVTNSQHCFLDLNSYSA